MARKVGRRPIDGVPVPVPAGGRLGPRRLLPIPANDNRLPRHVRLRRGLTIVALAVVFAWAVVEMIAAAL